MLNVLKKASVATIIFFVACLIVILFGDFICNIQYNDGVSCSGVPMQPLLESTITWAVVSVAFALAVPFYWFHISPDLTITAIGAGVLWLVVVLLLIFYPICFLQKIYKTKFRSNRQ